MDEKELNRLRRAVADYMQSEGCGCCQGMKHGKHREALARLLKVPRYDDGEGYNFAQFATKRLKV